MGDQKQSSLKKMIKEFVSNFVKTLWNLKTRVFKVVKNMLETV